LHCLVDVVPCWQVVRGSKEGHSRLDERLVAIRGSRTQLLVAADSASGIRLVDDLAERYCSCTGTLLDDGAYCSWVRAQNSETQTNVVD
jgi:hypothetical protein